MSGHDFTGCRKSRFRVRPTADVKPTLIAARRTSPALRDGGKIAQHAAPGFGAECWVAYPKKSEPALAGDTNGIPLPEFVAEAVEDKLADTGQRRWMTAFGKLRHLREETARINRLIEEKSENIEAADCL